MRLLLDTHALLWVLFDPSKLSTKARSMLEEGGNEGLFSQVSMLEIQIKVLTGKLQLDVPVPVVEEKAGESGLTLVPLSNQAIYTLPRLPKIHRDPFDRLLIAEAIQTQAALLTRDVLIAQYPVKTVW